MTELEPRPRRRAPARRRPWLRLAALLAGGLALLALGIALGMALQDRPTPGGAQTIVRTLEPLPQQAP